MSARAFVQNMFLRLGWDVRHASYPNSEEVLLKRFLGVARPDTILDVGANIGQYGASLRKCGFAGRIISFEAIASVHAKLSEVAARDPNWLVAPCCGLGRSPGETLINISANSVSSSLLAMHDAHLRTAPDSAYVRTETIRVARLDDIAKPLLRSGGNLLLKIDTQGYEEEVLRGAEGLLENVSAMQLELSVAPLYKGAPDLRRILDLCEQLGFYLHGLIPGFYEERSGRLLQMDGLFLKNETL